MFSMKTSVIVFLLSAITVRAHNTGFRGSVDCLPEDGVDPPNCNDYQHVTYIPHPYNCSKYWECEPENGHCLLECPKAGPHLILFFNPILNICDWPENVNCTPSGGCDSCLDWQTCLSDVCLPNCKSDSHCPSTQYCDYSEGGKGDCVTGCRGSDSCGNCGYCSHHVCKEPECCSDSDCKDSSICLNGVCKIECTVDTDCGVGEYCSNHQCLAGCTEDADCANGEYCSNHQCSAGCTENADCANGEYCSNHQCLAGCTEDAECANGEYCSNHQCLAGCTEDGDCANGEYCSNHQCLAGCTEDADCANGEYCSNHQCLPGCTEDADCEHGQYCSNHLCLTGCAFDSACPDCGRCIDHVCKLPECCVDSDCKDSNRPLCSASSQTCVEGCRKSSDCIGWDSECDNEYKNCSYCDQSTNQCHGGCINNDNCNGYHCNTQHTCSSGLNGIVLETYSCKGCQGAQGVEDEDGPFIILVGKSGTSCNTKQLDNPDRIDFDNGKVAEFSSKDILQSCHKADLGLRITDGGVHWTAREGVWIPRNQQIKINWSGSVDNECCCLSAQSLSAQSAVARIVNCQSCRTHPGC